MEVNLEYHAELEVPVLPPGIASCEGLPRQSWVTKFVTLTNEAGLEVARGICHCVDVDLVVDSDGMPLGENRVAIQFAESLCEDEVPSDWVFDLHSWHISHVFLNGVSLYDHLQTSVYNAAVKDSQRRARGGRRCYESARIRLEPNRPPKKKTLLSPASINAIASVSCCNRHCLQRFPRLKILELRTQLHSEGDVFFRKHRLLDVHNQMHKDSSGRDLITIEGVSICPIAWYIIMGIHKTTFYRYQKYARSGMRAEPHGNLGSKKARTHTIQATATLEGILENVADQMPHRSVTLRSGERRVSMCLPSSWRWNESLPRINEVNGQFQLPSISPSGLSRIVCDSFPEYATKARGDSFSRCGTCDKLKRLKSACTRGSRDQDIWSKRLETHNAIQKSQRQFYYAKRTFAKEYPDKMLTIIHDKMDHSKTASPHFSHKNKTIDSFMKLPISVTGMIAHGHCDECYAHYGLDIFPGDSNHTIGSLAKLLRDLESPPKNSSRELFVGGKSSSLFDALLEGCETCFDSLGAPPSIAIPAKPLPPVLFLQLDNCCGDNKNRWVFAFCSLLVYKGIFREVFINFLIVGHTHDDIDALFGRWSNKLKTIDYPTLPMLMKSFMDVDLRPLIPHLIEEVPNFKAFVDGYICTGAHALEGHTNAQHFRFFKGTNGWPLMKYKLFCNDATWLPSEGGGIKLWKEAADGSPMLPSGDPLPVSPVQMRSFDEIQKGLDGFVNLWGTMGNEDMSGEFGRLNEPLSFYWRGVKAALDDFLPLHETLQNRFWPISRYTEEVEDHFLDNGTLREEYGEDAPFIGRRCDRPAPSFRVARDVFSGYFVVLRPADDDPKPFWLARALTDPSPDPEHTNAIEIQYWTPFSRLHIAMDTYEGWDIHDQILWCEDKTLTPTWSSTDCIMTAWKPRIRSETESPRVKIPRRQISIIKDSTGTNVSEME